MDKTYNEENTVFKFYFKKINCILLICEVEKCLRTLGRPRANAQKMAQKCGSLHCVCYSCWKNSVHEKIHITNFHYWKSTANPEMH